MKIRRVVIKNFRKLTEIDFEIKKDLAVIVGPNAVGKSTIFEAIRLAKSILFPRMQDELRNVLIGLGASSAHFFNGQLNYDISALAGDIAKPVTVALTLELSANEIKKMGDGRAIVARNLVAAQLGRSPDDPTLDLRTYFSTPMGREAERAARVAVEETYKTLSSASLIETKVEITAEQIIPSSAIVNLLILLLEQSLPPDKAIFSYFPADRSMPTGEVALQIGPQDFKQQMDSHLAHAAAKYGRLKQTVVNHTVLSRIAGQDLKPEFDSIFQTFLPGKEFVGLMQKPTGLVAVQVRDQLSGKVFDIDSLSSGEKGLVLSFLLFRSSVSIGSITLVDELELHLNPAVCRKIIPYLACLIAEKSDCQFIISTHSAEIMRDAYEREDCQLFHLRSETDISPILPQDTQEILEAVTRLGVSTEQALTSRASLFVEGDGDVAILSAAFPALLSGIQIRPLNGRTEVEKSIRELQAAEAAGNLKERHAFLFDLDRRPSKLASSQMVRVEQLNKYCIENYLLDDVVLFDLITEHATKHPNSRGEFARELKELALLQLDDVILQELILPFRSIRIGLVGSEVRGKTVAAVATAQWERANSEFSEIKNIITDSNWIKSFETIHAEKRAELLPLWENDWRKLCSGKIVLENLQKKYQINLSLIRFKTILAEKLAADSKDDITALKGLVDRAIS